MSLIVFTKEEQHFVDTQTGGLWSGQKKQQKIVNMSSKELQGIAGYAITAKMYDFCERILHLQNKKRTIFLICIFAIIYG